MLRRLLLVLVVASTFACHRHKAADAPPPQPLPPPPPPPCDVIGSWQAQPPLPLGPQQIDVAPTDKPGVFSVRSHTDANVMVGTIKTNTTVPVDTNMIGPIYNCSVGSDCNTMTCAFTGGAAPAVWKRMP